MKSFNCTSYSSCL